MVGDVEDAQREAKEERLMPVMAENVRDAVQVEVARLRDELRGVGHSLSSFLLTCAWP